MFELFHPKSNVSETSWKGENEATNEFHFSGAVFAGDENFAGMQIVYGTKIGINSFDPCTLHDLNF